jgi:hypothetical protein
MINSSIGFMWYQRPSELFFYMLQASKTNGKTQQAAWNRKTYKKQFWCEFNLILKMRLTKGTITTTYYDIRIVPFEEILTSVKDENRYWKKYAPFTKKKVRSIFRAEREIGYGGIVAVKKRTYKINTPTTGSILSFQTILLNLKE